MFEKRSTPQKLTWNLKGKGETTTRWAPTSYKWSCNPYKWPYKWVTGVITPISEVITLLITGRGPTLYLQPTHFLGSMLVFDGCSLNTKPSCLVSIRQIFSGVVLKSFTCRLLRFFQMECRTLVEQWKNTCLFRVYRGLYYPVI